MITRDAHTWLYPPIEPFHTERLAVSGGHELYVEQCGNPAGKPVVFLHGGPGGGVSPRHRQLFDPRAYRVVLFDQRGSGKSTPVASVVENTTSLLVADIEKIRTHLGLPKWLVFGGSWGSTLALAYAEQHPQQVTGLILRGVFLGTQREIEWAYRPDVLGALFPEGWEAFVALIPVAERGDLLGAYARRLASPDPAIHGPAAAAWNVWETRLSSLVASPEALAEAAADPNGLAVARLEVHYFQHGCFLQPDQLIRDAGNLAEIDGVIVQGRYDLVCPFENAYRLHQAWPKSDLRVIADAGHSAFESNIARALIAATDQFRGQSPMGDRQ